MTIVRWHRNARGRWFEMPSRLRDRVVNVTGLLVQFPQLGVVIETGDFEGARRLLVAGWSVVYTHSEQDDSVDVLLIVSPGGPVPWEV